MNIQLINLLRIQLNAQSDQTDKKQANHQIWLDFYPHFYISEKLEYYGDAGYRTILNEEFWHRLYVRPSLRYHINNLWEFHAGVGLFYIITQLNVNRFEVTPWQGIRFNWPRFKNLKFSSLLRLEERISFLTHNWSSSFDFRLRYKLSGQLTILATTEESFWFIPFYIELFFSVFDDIEEFFRNRGRVGGGLGFNASKDWRFEFIVNCQTSRVGPEEDLSVSDYAYQIKIRRLWNFKELIKF
jgi:hypothetical protein